MDRPTFSQAWSRVSRLTPALRPQVQIHRQLYRGEPWHIVHDPVSNNFFRLNPVAYHLVGTLDGKRSIDEAWRMTLERFGDAAPTQNEVIGLLGQLNESNLLRVDLPADAAPLLKRQQTRRLRQWGGQLMSILSLRFPVFNPNRMLEWLLPFFRPVLTKWGLMAWAAWLIFCITIFAPNLHVFARDAESVLAPANWGWMILLFLVVKAWHELGHGVVCKKMGGSVPEVGIMLLVLFPAPYVDATSSWNFPDKWKRLLVGAAGMIFELALAGAAAIIWVNTDEGLVHQLAYNVVFLASVTTILFNGNPLLRFDGYYMLSDLLEIPNLYDRSGRQLRWFWQVYGFGLRNTQIISSLPGEQAFLGIYGVLSQVYRVIIMFSISLFIANKIPTLGLIIAAWSIISWACIPTGKFIHWLITSPALQDHRPRAIGVSLATLIVLGLPLGGIPVRDHRRAPGVIESRGRADVVIQTEGFISEVLAAPGDRVAAGQLILKAVNPALSSQQKELQAQLRGLEIAQRQTLAKDPVEIKMNQARLKAIREQLAEVDDRVTKLELHSPRAGVLTGNDTTQLVGQFLKRGQVVAQVEDLSDLRVTALVDQAENASGFFDEIRDVEVRTVSNVTRVIPSRVVGKVDAGQHELPHPSLGYQGGGTIPTSPEDKHGQTSLRPQFEVWLDLPEQAVSNTSSVKAPAGHPGERVYVRFTLATQRPLLFQWVHRLRQVIRDRLAW